jgi:surfeit locus 1 family protein
MLGSGSRIPSGTTKKGRGTAGRGSRAYAIVTILHRPAPEGRGQGDAVQGVCVTVATEDRQQRSPRSTVRLAAFGALILFWFVAFCWLGTWQVHRRAWKHALIASVDARVHAPPVAAPGPDAWGRAGDLAYLHVRLHGHFLNDRETLTQAVSDYGTGAWVMTPLVTDRGFTVLVNRGFVPDDRRAASTRAEAQPQGEVTVIGLLRTSEPKGGFLQSNNPQADQWHSRDVAAIAAKRGLPDVAPYFVDADGAANPGGWPRGGLTVIRFPDNHLQYAITWYALAAMMLLCGAILIRSERKARGE